MGENTEVVQAWTTNDAIIKYGDTEESSVLNVLQVAVDDETVRFIINEEEVAAVDATEINSEGIFGLRVNHSVNLHISDLSLAER